MSVPAGLPARGPSMLAPVSARLLGVRQLVAIFALLTTIPLALLTYASVTLSTSAVDQEVRAKLRSTTQVSAVAVQREMEGLADVVDAYASRPSLIAALGGGDSSRYDGPALVGQLAELNDRRGIGVTFLTDARGAVIDIVPATPSVIGQDFSFRDWYRGATTTGKPYVSEAFRGAATGTPLVVAAAAPIWERGAKGGRMIGVLGATYDLATIQAFTEQIARAQGVSLTITDHRGVVVAHRGGTPQALESLGADPLVAAALRGESGTTDRDAAGESVLTSYAPVAGIGWTVRADVPERTAFASVYELRSTVVAVAGVLGLVLVAGIGLLGITLRRRRQAEAAIEKSEQRLRTILDAAKDAFISVDESGRIREWNRQAERTFGWARAEAIGRPVVETILGDRRVTARENLARMFREGETAIPRTPVETVLARRDGEPFDAEVLMWLVESDGGPTINSLVRDITERRQAEAAHSQLAAIVESSQDAILSKTLDGVIVSWNAGAERLYGYAADEAVGRPLSMLVPEDRSDEILEGLERARGERVEPHETVRIRKDGTPVHVSLTVSPMRDATGAIVGVSTIARDITDRKRLDEELQAAHAQAVEASRLKSEFLANMSHEIRTPMNGIIGMTELLLGSDLREEQRRYGETIQRSAESLLAVINDVLDFSKIEAGRMDLEVIDFDLRSVVEESMELLAERAHAKGLELAALIEADVPNAVRGDPGRLRQVLLNLAGNGVKFTDAGEVVLRVRMDEPNGEHLVVRFEVTDTGIGIATEDQERLFESFSQADASTTRRYGGSGLGLAISKQLVLLMGGTIGVTSKRGEGSTFWFTVRLERGVETRTPRPSKVNLRGLRVLVVDDNATNRMILEQGLRGWGMQPTLTSEAAEALEALREAAGRGAPFELALIDLAMPGMDGLAMARAVTDDPAIRATPMVLLTSSPRRGAARAARQAGIRGFLTKPVRQSLLYDTIVDVLAPRPPERTQVLVTRHTVAEERRGRRPRVLIAEDNEVNQKVAVLMLERLGYRVDVAATGVQAVEAASGATYDAVLMDCQMPEMDGYEATIEIRRREGSARHTPIIALTAGAMAGDAEKCLAAGMDDYLGKPVKLEQLEAALQRWLRRRDPDERREEDAGTTASVDQRHDVVGKTTGGDDATRDLEPALDAAVIASLRELGEGRDGSARMPDLVRLFADEARSSLEGIERAIASGDANAVRALAHALKGSAGVVGATRMNRLSVTLEKAAARGDLNEAPELLTRLRVELERVDAEFRAGTGTETGVDRSPPSETQRV